MPYMSQEHKKEIHTKLKPIFNEYEIKATLGVHNHSTIVVNIQSSPIDFIGNFNEVQKSRSMNEFDRYIAKDHLDVNPFWYHQHFDGEALEFLTKVMSVLNDKNGVEVEDGDYGRVPHYYVDINIGKWDKPYILTQKEVFA